MDQQLKQIRLNNKYKNRPVVSEIKKPLKSFGTKDVQECIQKITSKMQNAKITTLHPPYFQKSLTKFRNQSFSFKLKKQISQKMHSNSQIDFKAALQLLNSFVQNFDQEFIDTYIQQIREPYIRKIFNQSYEIDKVDFKKLNSEYQLRKQIQEVLNQTSQWLIQIQLIEDILDRIELYFGIRSDTIIEKLKTEGAEDRKGSWGHYFSSVCKRTISFVLRKGSKVIQNTGYASMLTPAFAMLTWAIIGGSATIPWKGGVDAKSLLIPVLAFTIPYMLDGMAQSIQRNDFKAMLQSWAQQFQYINKNLRSFSEMLLEQMKFCCKSSNESQYKIHLTNLQKYVHNLSKQVQKVSKYDEKSFQEMRQRTNAYFTKWIQIKDEDDQWITIMTPQQYQKYKENKNRKN